jgi:hypothetical protein
VIVPIGALGAVRVRPLKVNVRPYREPNVDGWVPGLEQVANTAALRKRRLYPRFDRVSKERVMRPLRNFVTDAVDVLERPAPAAVAKGVEP